MEINMKNASLQPYPWSGNISNENLFSVNHILDKSNFYLHFLQVI